MMLIPMDRNSPLFPRLVQLVCYQHNQNDLEIFEKQGRIQSTFGFTPYIKQSLPFFSRAHPRLHEHHHFHRDDEVQLNEEELRQIAMSTHDTVRQPPPSTTTTTTAAAAKPDATASSTPSSDKLINSAALSKTDPRNDGTLSDSVLSSQPGDSNKKRRPSMSSKALVILGLSKKTNSTSNLGYGRYLTDRLLEKYDVLFSRKTFRFST